VGKTRGHSPNFGATPKFGECPLFSAEEPRAQTGLRGGKLARIMHESRANAWDFA
jgi:hypothetical protein